MLDPLIIDSIDTPDSCFICLHGLGASPDDLAPVAHLLSASLPHTRFVFPAAPSRPVTANGGYYMPAWYDILAFEPQRQLNHQHIEQSCTQIEQLIAEQRSLGITQIYLAGFSQGGAIAYHCALQHAEPLAGLLCMSTYIPLPPQLHPQQRQLKVLVQHGLQDKVVAPELAEQAISQLTQLGLQAQIETYPHEHTISPQQIKALAKWLTLSLYG